MNVLNRFARPLLFDFLFDFFELHDVGVFVMHVEEIDPVRQRTTIEYALFDNGNVIAERIGIDAARAHTAAGALAADDQAIYTQLSEMRERAAYRKNPLARS